MTFTKTNAAASIPLMTDRADAQDIAESGASERDFLRA